jgi:hypothetical protein
VVGTPTAINAVANQVSATSATVQISDVTNSTVIATSAAFTNTTQTIINLGAISNIPVNEAIWEVQGLATGGGGGRRCQVGSIEIIYN